MSGDTKTVDIEVPEKEWTERRPAAHGPDERKKVWLRDGPSIAFVHDSIRLYDKEMDAFVELEYAELIDLLTQAYGPSQP